MLKQEAIELISLGESSKVQFKQDISSPNQLAEEFVAFSNTLGGVLLIGISDNSEIVGLSQERIKELNQLIANVANENIKPAISPITEIIEIEAKKIILVEIKQGIYKPYSTNKGQYFIKVGSDKRIASQEELQRLFQASNKIYADEIVLPATNADLDLDKDKIEKFILKKFDQNLASLDLSLNQALHNLGLIEEQHVTLAALLCFGKEPQKFRPSFMVKAVCFLGNDTSSTEYIDSKNINGTIAEQFDEMMIFAKRNLRGIQAPGEGFNSLPVLEIPKETLEELFVNALVHRDYFIDAPIRLLIFENRIELISPGKLPNSLQIENIKSGQSISRNPIILNIAQYIMPYRGLGSGVPRAIKFYPNIEFVNDTQAELFRVVIHRKTVY